MTTDSLNLRVLAPVYQRSTIYRIFLRTFTNQGTLKAAEQMLPHWLGLGVDILYLCPIADSDDDMDQNGWSPRQKASGLSNPQNPYRIKDYYSIDPEYGSDQDLKDFVKKAHYFGMKVILDLVYLHCGPTGVFIEKHPDYVQRNDDGSIKTNDYNFPLINFESEDLREYLWQNMEYFIREFDVDGYRCDVAFEVPLDFWEAARPRMEALKPDVFMLSESYGKPEDHVSAFDVSYGLRFPYELYDVFDRKKSAFEFRQFLEKQTETMRGANVLRSIDNRDLANDFQCQRQDTRYSFEAVNCMLALCFSLDGLPFLYNGQEVADTNRHTIYSNREHGQNHTVDWANALTPKGKIRKSLVQSLIALRKQERALFSGTRTWLENNQAQSVLSFSREADGSRIIAVFNLSSDTVQAKIETSVKGSSATAIAQSDAHAKMTEDTLTIDLLPYGYTLLKVVD